MVNAKIAKRDAIRARRAEAAEAAEVEADEVKIEAQVASQAPTLSAGVGVAADSIEPEKTFFEEVAEVQAIVDEANTLVIDSATVQSISLVPEEDALVGSIDSVEGEEFDLNLENVDIEESVESQPEKKRSWLSRG